MNCLARFNLLSLITMSFPPQPFLKPTKPMFSEYQAGCGSLEGVKSRLSAKSSSLWAARVSSCSERVVSVRERVSSSCEESKDSLAGSGCALCMNYKCRTSKQESASSNRITVFFQMKGKKTIALPLLAKRLLRLQSSVFTKLYLYSECSDVETQGDSHAKNMTTALERIEGSLKTQQLRCAFEKVQAAGWKRIPEAQTDEEEDSQRSSISCRFSDQSLSILPRSEGLLEDSTNTLPSFQPCYSQKATPFSLFRKGQSADITQDSSQASRKTLRVSKRALILKKLESIEAGVEYLGVRLRLGQ